MRCQSCGWELPEGTKYCEQCGQPQSSASVRVAIPPKLRFEVFKRDDFTCRYCGRKPPAVTLHVDHKLPVAEGGTNDILNLVTACEDCNRGKGASPLPDDSYLRQALLQAERDERVRLLQLIEQEARDIRRRVFYGTEWGDWQDREDIVEEQKKRGERINRRAAAQELRRRVEEVGLPRRIEIAHESLDRIKDLRQKLDEVETKKYDEERKTWLDLSRKFDDKVDGHIARIERELKRLTFSWSVHQRVQREEEEKRHRSTQTSS